MKWHYYRKIVITYNGMIREYENSDLGRKQIIQDFEIELKYNKEGEKK
jgi:hypothetical protein